jgi:hypothetical protein
MIYKNQNILMPLDIGYCLETKKIIINTPCPVRTTKDVWVFDNYELKHRNHYHWARVMAVNPDYGFKGIPRGCQFFLFQTLENENNNFQIIRSRSFVEKASITCTPNHPHEIRFITFVYPFPNAMKVFIWEELDFWGDKKTFGLLDPPDLDTLYSTVDTPYRHSVLYFMRSEAGNNDYVWASTTEYLCYPKMKGDAEETGTYASCVSFNAHQMKNKRVWVENSNDPFFEYVKWWNSLTLKDKKKSLKMSNGNEQHTANDWLIYFKMIVEIFFVLIIAVRYHQAVPKKTNK